MSSHHDAFEQWIAEQERQYGAMLATIAATRGKRNRLSIANMRPWLELAWEAGINVELKEQRAEALRREASAIANGQLNA